MADYGTKPVFPKKTQNETLIIKEVADFTHLPEIQKAVESAAMYTATRIVNHSKPGTASPSNGPSGKNEPALQIGEVPAQLVDSIEHSYYTDPDKLRLVTAQYAVVLLEDEKDRKRQGSPSPGTGDPAPAPSSQVPAQPLSDIVQIITNVEAFAYNKGNDKGDFAKQASQYPEAFKEDLRKSLLANPETVELIKELPRAIHMAKLAAGNISH